MSEFQPFVMERMMSKWENVVDYNLSESGVHPLRLRELLDDDPERIDHLLGTELDWDSEHMTFPNRPTANQYLHMRYREGWSLT